MLNTVSRTWGVLGLRLLGSCDITLMSQSCVHDDAREDAQAFDKEPSGAFDKLSSGGEFSSAAAVLNCGVVLVERNSVLDDGWEVGHHTVSSLTAGIWDQASGRVDVPGGVSKFAAATQGPSIRFALLNSKNTVLARDVSTMCRTSHLCFRLSELTGVPQCHFYLTHQGRVLVDEDTLKRHGCGRDSPICMCSVLKGGGKPPVVPGSWHCSVCNLGGCWPSRNTCFHELKGGLTPPPKPCTPPSTLSKALRRGQCSSDDARMLQKSLAKFLEEQREDAEACSVFFFCEREDRDEALL